MIVDHIRLISRDDGYRLRAGIDWRKHHQRDNWQYLQQEGQYFRLCRHSTEDSQDQSGNNLVAWEEQWDMN